MRAPVAVALLLCACSSAQESPPQIVDVMPDATAVEVDMARDVADMAEAPPIDMAEAPDLVALVDMARPDMARRDGGQLLGEGCEGPESCYYSAWLGVHVTCGPENTGSVCCVALGARDTCTIDADCCSGQCVQGGGPARGYCCLPINYDCDSAFIGDAPGKCCPGLACKVGQGGHRWCLP